MHAKTISFEQNIILSIFMDHTTEKLKNAFIRALGIDETIVNDTLAYQSVQQWDSITHMILISEIESEFDISIETDDVIDMSSFGKAREIVLKYQ